MRRRQIIPWEFILTGSGKGENGAHAVVSRSHLVLMARSLDVHEPGPEEVFVVAGHIQ